MPCKVCGAQAVWVDRRTNFDDGTIEETAYCDTHYPRGVSPAEFMAFQPRRFV